MGYSNIGVEEIKGVEEVRQAHAWLKENELPIDYCGFVEGDQIGQGIADVIVVEGFAGNIALKTAEGTAKQMAAWVREALIGSSAAGARRLPGPEGACARLKDRMDPRRFNGGPFLRPQRHRDQELRRHRRLRLRQRHRGRLTRWPESNVIERLTADLGGAAQQAGRPPAGAAARREGRSQTV